MKDAGPEIKCSFGIVIWHTDEDFEDLKTTIESVKNIDYHKKNFGFAVCIKDKLAKDIGIQTFVSMIQELKKEEYYAFLNVSSGDQSVKDREDDCFSLISQGKYLLKMTSGQEIEPTFFSSVNEMSEEELDKYPIFRKDDIVLVSKALASSRYYEFSNYDEMVQCITKNDDISQETYVLNEK